MSAGRWMSLFGIVVFSALWRYLRSVCEDPMESSVGRLLLRTLMTFSTRWSFDPEIRLRMTRDLMLILAIFNLIMFLFDPQPRDRLTSPCEQTIRVPPKQLVARPEG